MLINSCTHVRICTLAATIHSLVFLLIFDFSLYIFSLVLWLFILRLLVFWLLILWHIILWLFILLGWIYPILDLGLIRLGFFFGDIVCNPHTHVQVHLGVFVNLGPALSSGGHR